MTRICWFICLLSWAVSTPTVLGQETVPANPVPNVESVEETVDPCPNANPMSLRELLEEYVRSLQHGCGSPCTPPMECTRFRCQPRPVAIDEVTTPDREEGLTDSELPDCCQEPSTATEPRWTKQMANWMRNCFGVWQRGSCQMSQATQAVCGAMTGAGAAPTASQAPAAPTASSSGEWLLHPPQYFPPSPPFALPREARTIVIRLTPADVRRLKEHGIDERLIFALANRCEETRTAKACPYVQAVKNCPYLQSMASAAVNPFSAVVPWLANTCKPCCESVMGRACCNGIACQACEKKADGSCCPFFLFRFSTASVPADQDANGVPTCVRGTAEKPGCCDNCKCGSCCKPTSAGQDSERAWSTYMEVLSRMLSGLEHLLPNTNLTWMECPQQPNISGLPPMSGGFCPPPTCLPGMTSPGMGMPPCMGGVLPPPPQSPFATCPGLPCHPGQFSAFAPTPPWMGYGSPVAGWAPPAVHMPCPPGAMPWGWNPGMMPAAPYLQVVPVAESRPQPVSLPRSAPSCMDECKIVARDGVVQFSAGNIEARCTSITCSANRDRVVLEGNVHLTCKNGNETTRIEAPRVVIDPNQGTFTIESGNAPAPVNLDSWYWGGCFFH